MNLIYQTAGRLISERTTVKRMRRSDEMAGRVENRVAFVTGAGLGEGLSHALRVAEEGAYIIAVDGRSGSSGFTADLTTERDLKETAELVEALGRRVVTGVAHVRDGARLKAMMDSGRNALGRLDIVVASAPSESYPASREIGEACWNQAIESEV
jgi:(+)-trans-carveol dehydrogenase